MQLLCCIGLPSDYRTSAPGILGEPGCVRNCYGYDAESGNCIFCRLPVRRILKFRLKVATKGKKLWVRTILSTVVGEGLDSVIFIMISFWGTMDNSVVLQMILFQYLFKVAYEALFTPVTYVVVKAIKKAEGIDVYDEGIKYNLIRG